VDRVKTVNASEVWLVLGHGNFEKSHISAGSQFECETGSGTHIDWVKICVTYVLTNYSLKMIRPTVSYR
jgi:hypothetical protein